VEISIVLKLACEWWKVPELSTNKILPTVHREQAADQIQEACKQIALQLMKIHPAIGKLDAPETQAACLKAAHQLTVELETIKKQIIRLRKADDSTDL
jgi:hypothetical protein